MAAAIAGPMCVICALIMLFICWHQKRQMKKQGEFQEAEAALQPVEDEALIPPGQTLKELMDMSTGIILFNVHSVLHSFLMFSFASTWQAL